MTQVCDRPAKLLGMTVTQWRDAVGHPGYEVSNDGQVRSLPRVITRSNGRRQTIHGGLLRPAVGDRFGHLVVNLNSRTHRYVHALVAEAFLGPRPDGSEVLHRNDDPSDNRVENLRYGTHAENMRDCVTNGNDPRMQRDRCPRGHQLVEPNLVPSRAPHRVCLACARAHSYIGGLRRRGCTLPDFKAQADEYHRKIMGAVR